MLIQERDCEILLWLDHMGFSHLDQIARVFFKSGVNPKRAPYRKMLKIAKKGLIETVKVYSDPRHLYVITRKGVRLLRSLKKYPYVIGALKDKRFKQYEHDKGLIELRIFALKIGLGLWIPERVIRSIKPKGSSPDALLVTNSCNYAIEYELHRKAPSRYAKIFSRYGNDPKYKGVLYILPTESKIETLKKRISHIPRNIYFISEYELYQDKENAVFCSSSDEFPLKDLIQSSRKESIRELEREKLKKVILSEAYDFSGSGGGKANYDSYEAYDIHEETNDPLIWPKMYPSMVSDGGQYEDDDSADVV